MFVARAALAVFGWNVEEGPLNIQFWAGSYYLGALRGVSTAFLMIVGFSADGSRTEESARISGARLVVFFKITLPLLRQRFSAAATYSSYPISILLKRRWLWACRRGSSFSRR